ncbi:PAS domain-containing sensor histidine kinase [Cesiribacter andamanensis]|uniref:histidine kinase n=1 Tax=Cesiribacter andamanensis AMV16 TaxID=1279009 RepID=M7N0Q9_9BACT|nr:ATP-binding protein [Cesiribacter andamanensis]EMR00781.1 Phytochrome-like protein cph1 [Cesiribacter andamanensis AMV16]
MRYQSSTTLLLTQLLPLDPLVTTKGPDWKMPPPGPSEGVDYHFLIHPQKISIYAGEQLSATAPELQLPLLVHPTDAARLIKELLRTHDTETPAAVTAIGRLQALDGHQWIDCELTAHALPGSYKDLLGWHVVARQCRPAEEPADAPLLQVLAHMYRAGQWEYSPQQGCLKLDQTLLDLLKLPRLSGFTPQSLFHHFSRADRTRLLKQVFQVQRKGGFFQLHLRFKTPVPGKVKSITISGGAFHSPEGALYLAGLCFDNTQVQRYYSKQKLTSAFLDETQDLAKIGCFEWNPSIQKLRTTPQLRKLIGLPADARPTPDQLDHLLAPADLQQLMAAYNRLLNGTPEQELTLQIRLPQGQQRTLWFRARVMEQKDRLLTLIGIVQDVSERIERQVQLESRDRIISGFLENLPVSIIAIDNTETIVSVAGNGLARLKGPSRSAAGLPLAQVLPELQPELREVLKGQARSFHTEHQQGKQSNSFFNHFYFDEQRQLAIGFMLDTSEQKQAEHAARQVKHLEHRHQLMDTFVHAVAHDLRAPVVNLDMLLHFFKEEKVPSEQDRYVTAMSNGVQHLKRTLDALIEILRLEKDSNLHAEHISFQELLEELKEEWQDKLQEAGGALTTFLQCESICYNRAYLSSILRNLISNAIKYSAPGRPPQITICTEIRGNVVMLLVQDNGIGMDLKKWKHLLFQPFKRLNNYKKGTGIGLHLIRQMIEKNGGKIKVKSLPGEGSTFFCFLRPYATPPGHPSTGL